MKFSIRSRLLLFSLLLILTGVTLTGGIALYIQIQTLEENHKHFGKDLAEIVGKNILDPLHNLETHKLKAQLQTLTNNKDFTQTLILDTEGVILVDGTEENRLQEEQIEALMPVLNTLKQSTQSIKVWDHNNHIAVTHRIVTPFNEFLGYLHLELSRKDIDNAITDSLQQFLLVEVLLLIFSVFAGQLLANYFHRPLQEAVSTANAIASGDFKSQPSSKRKDEFGDLSRALQQMALQIDETINTLSGTQQELEEIFRSMVDGVLVIDNEGNIIKLNQRMELLCRQIDSELIGHPLSELFSEEFAFSDFNEEGSQETLIRPDDEIPVQVYGALIQTPHMDTPIGSVLVIHDLSDRIIAERQEQYAAFQAGIAEMGASVLHNIGNVITGMTGHLLKLQSKTKPLGRLLPSLTKYAEESQQIASESDDLEVLRGRLVDSSKVLKGTSESLHKIHNEFDGLQKMEHGIRHIGDIISIQQSASRPVITATRFNLGQLVDDTYNLIDERLSKYNVEWNATINSEVKSVFLPRNPLMQLLLNLIKNSLEAIIQEMLDNHYLVGSISLSIEPYDQQSIMITVEDNGCGILPEVLEKVFTPRFTTKSTGSGYGLHSASNFVHPLGGSIEAKSDGPHTGSKIIITLPIAVDQQHEESNKKDTPY
ncbi:MAG: HAMP domain-containing protein [Gammaproteobacteria bacterium]|jgi:PAS domain S-box-containing protein|nr:HAMP domain-containing protein [Gammaproteobacteria bacterium]MBT4606076.1 HAMP domain-containing protein [Thiotrichales bacterium]MBT3471871.1 HAMP domain-containing protein [Gammaproteobacteria bacterium]MBT3967118.1 HAMP domain-containing protein [Gammaproteobacteria bacterium]MBT4082014.1 HAMP domain-containing protein [Gammaproteobacteria bacterium]